MRVAQIEGYKEPLVLAEAERPSPAPGQVLVRVAACGACHSDPHRCDGELPMLPSFPWVLGHEVAGYVDSLRPGVERPGPGEAAAVFGGWGCGRCRRYLSGEEQTLQMAARMAGPGGIIGIVGLAGGALPVSLLAVPPAVEVVSSYWGTRLELEEVLALARGGHLVDNLERHPLAEINEVFERLRADTLEGRAVLVP